MPVSDEEIASFWQLVRKSASLMDREGESIFGRSLGISHTRFLILHIVDSEPGPLTQQAISDLLGLTKGTVSRQIESAQNDGQLISEVSPASRREKLVTLTRSGRALVQRGDELLAHSQFLAFSGMDEKDLLGAIRVLESFTAARPAES